MIYEFTRTALFNDSTPPVSGLYDLNTLSEKDFQNVCSFNFSPALIREPMINIRSSAGFEYPFLRSLSNSIHGNPKCVSF